MRLTDRIKTIGDFMSRIQGIKETPNSCLYLSQIKMWIEDIVQETHAGAWEEFMHEPVAHDNIIMLANTFHGKIAYQVSIFDTVVLYNKCRRRGHRLLRAIYRLAKRLKIEVELEEIDRPLTPSEAMLQAGLVESKGGKIHLTESGEALAAEFETELKREGYKLGDTVKFTCYNRGCEGVELEAKLGKDCSSLLYAGFVARGHVGRVKWDPQQGMKEFDIDAPIYVHIKCPICGKCFDSVLIVTSPSGEEILFGYESE